MKRILPLVALTFLTACGLRPVYGGGSHGAVAQGLGHVEVQDIAGKGGAPYRQRQAVCLETQYFPNANICKNFPSTVLRAGNAYHETTVYSFSHR